MLEPLDRHNKHKKVSKNSVISFASNDNVLTYFNAQLENGTIEDSFLNVKVMIYKHQLFVPRKLVVSAGYYVRWYVPWPNCYCKLSAERDFSSSHGTYLLHQNRIRCNNIEYQPKVYRCLTNTKRSPLG